MNKQAIFNGLCAITRDKYAVCKAEAESVGKDHPIERGALQLKAGIYNVAIAAGLLAGDARFMELMSKRFCNLIKHFPDLAFYYQGLSEDEKGMMEIALYPEVFMKVNFYNKYHTDLAEAEKDGDTQQVFKARIKKEVLDDILDMWRNFRVQNSLFAFAFEEKEGS